MKTLTTFLTAALLTVSATAADFIAYLDDPRTPGANYAIVMATVTPGAETVSVYTVWMVGDARCLLVATEGGDVVYTWAPANMSTTQWPAEEWPSGILTGRQVAIVNGDWNLALYGAFEEYESPAAKMKHRKLTKPKTAKAKTLATAIE